MKTRYIDSKKISLVFRFYPDGKMSPVSYRSALAGVCAERQHKFWALHDLIFARTADPRVHTVEQETTELDGLAASAGVDEVAFQSCTNSVEPYRAIAEDAGNGVIFALSATPTLFIGTRQPDGRIRAVRRLRGGPSFEELEPILESVLSTTGR